MQLFLRSLIVLLCITVFGCDTSNNSQSEKTLIMGTSSGNPPFEVIENGQFKGLDIDIANAIATKLGYKLVIKDMEFFALIPELQIKKIDFAIAAMTITQERKELVDFSTAYYAPAYALVYRSTAPMKMLQDMGGKRIGVLLGTTMEGFLRKLQLQGLGFELLFINGHPEDLVQGVVSGHLDGALIEEAQASIFTKRTPVLGFSVFEDYIHGGYAVVLQKGSSLTPKINEVLQDMKKSGELSQIKKKWEVKDW